MATGSRYCLDYCCRDNSGGETQWAFLANTCTLELKVQDNISLFPYIIKRVHTFQKKGLFEKIWAF